jgi:hypothetical protein
MDLLEILEVSAEVAAVILTARHFQHWRNKGLRLR